MHIILPLLLPLCGSIRLCIRIGIGIGFQKADTPKEKGEKADAPEGNAKLEEDKENENEGNKGAHQEDVPIHTKYWSKMIEMSPFSGSAATEPDKPEARAPTTSSAPPIQSALRACLPHLPPALHPVDPDALSRASPEPR